MSYIRIAIECAASFNVIDCQRMITYLIEKKKYKIKIKQLIKAAK